MQQYKLRLPEPLKAQLEDAAKAADRSLNSEIIWRLGQSFHMDLLNQRLKEVEQLRRETQERLNRMTDWALQVTSQDMVLVRKDQIK